MSPKAKTNWGRSKNRASKKKENLRRAERCGTEAKKMKHNAANQFCDVIRGWDYYGSGCLPSITQQQPA